jgi:hypothetical protein
METQREIPKPDHQGLLVAAGEAGKAPPQSFWKKHNSVDPLFRLQASRPER